MSESNRNLFNPLLVATSLLLVAVLLLSGVMATRAIDNDGRINLVAHLGGDVIYCVDANRNVADNFAEGGLLLMSKEGQHLFFVPVADISAVPELPEVNTLIAEGTATYGPVALWRLTDGDFLLIGQDEYGKTYNFQWKGCSPVGPTSDDLPSSADEDCVDGVTGAPGVPGVPGPNGPNWPDENGNDTFDSGSGNDTLEFGESGNDTLGARSLPQSLFAAPCAEATETGPTGSNGNDTTTY